MKSFNSHFSNSFFFLGFLFLIPVSFAAQEDSQEDVTVETLTYDQASFKINHPFFMPQTNLYLGNVSYFSKNTDNLKAAGLTLSESGLNMGGFDLEINAGKRMNIGAYFRYETIGDWFYGQRTSPILGGFTRFFYIPPFLEKRSFTANVFIRPEMAVAPSFIVAGPVFNGIGLQGGLHIGTEVYFNRWWGLSFTYGKLMEYAWYSVNRTGSARMFSTGTLYLISFKTTWL